MRTTHSEPVPIGTIAHARELALLIGLSFSLSCCGQDGGGPRGGGGSVANGTPMSGWAPDTLRGLAGKCLDVLRGDSADGAKVQLWNCNTSNAQIWRLHDAEIRTTTGDKCIEVHGNRNENGTVIQVWECNHSAAQNWSFDDGTIRNVGGRCLGTTLGQTGNGAEVRLFDCNGGETQKWTYVAGQIRGSSGRCLDVRDGKIENGTPLQLWDCAAVPQQQFEFRNALIISSAGSCLDVDGLAPANGTKVQQWSCHGAANQRWNLSGTSVRSQTNGKCLEVAAGRTNDGAQVQVSDCTGPPSQDWVRGNLASAPVPPVAEIPSALRGECKFGGSCARETATAAHSGVDLGVGVGTPVYAICDAEVRIARDASTTPRIWDRFTVLHAEYCGGHRELEIFYGHIDAATELVRAREEADRHGGIVRVTRGQYLGAVADWGDNTHLHLGLKIGYIPRGWGYPDIGISTPPACGSKDDPLAPDQIRKSALAAAGWIDPVSFAASYAWWGTTIPLAPCADGTQ